MALAGQRRYAAPVEKVRRDVIEYVTERLSSGTVRRSVRLADPAKDGRDPAAIAALLAAWRDICAAGFEPACSEDEALEALTTSRGWAVLYARPARSVTPVTTVAPDSLRAARQRIGWTLREAARRWGVAHTTIRAWERGQRRPPPEYVRWLQAIAEAVERLS